MTNPRLAALAAHGVSIWLDDLSRERIASGNLAELIAEDSVTGVTTNPSIFQAALADGEAYADQLRSLAEADADVDHAVFLLTTRDVRDACDIFAPVAQDTGGIDGRVSIEVDPRLAHETEATIEQARALHAAVGRDNVLIKIPATIEGLPAITAALAEGISVNVTLIFSLERYRAVVNAFLAGLEQARAKGLDLASIHSVASFFVSRVDTEVDARLGQIEGEAASQAAALMGQAGIANARLAYQVFEEMFGSARWESLSAVGARPQRPLWASTGVKNPDYPDTMYVTELVAPNTVNTMPEATLRAVADHAEVHGDTIRGRYDEARAVLDALEQLGISYADVTELLERQGVDKFEKAWDALLTGVRAAMEGARA
ncbi:MAG: transaldolase [Phycicoccus sp.]|nr:transaldolase [Phycicoccus sp.]